MIDHDKQIGIRSETVRPGMSFLWQSSVTHNMLAMEFIIGVDNAKYANGAERMRIYILRLDANPTSRKVTTYDCDFSLLGGDLIYGGWDRLT